MPSTIYTRLLNTINPYLDSAKAIEVVARQLPLSGQTADTLNLEGLKKMASSVSGSVSLYVADKAKREELVEALKKLVA